LAKLSNGELEVNVREFDDSTRMKIRRTFEYAICRCVGHRALFHLWLSLQCMVQSGCVEFDASCRMKIRGTCSEIYGATTTDNSPNHPWTRFHGYATMPEPIISTYLAQ
jgi:hypothetical protein